MQSWNKTEQDGTCQHNYIEQMNETKNNNQLQKDWKWVKLKKMWQLFGDKTDEIINELNEVLAA